MILHHSLVVVAAGCVLSLEIILYAFTLKHTVHNLENRHLKTPFLFVMVLKHWSLSPEKFYQLENTLQYAGPLFFMCLHLGTLQTAWKMHKHQSSGILSGAPFISLFVTSFVWTLYGIMLPDITLAYPSLFGVVAGFMSCATFNVYATPDSANSLYTTIYPCALVAVSTAIVLANLGHVQWLGRCGAVIAVCSLASSHGAEFQNAVRDKSTASLSYFSSLLMWLNALAWATYALIIRGDSNIFIPNIVSFVVATMQLHLFMLYGHNFSSVAALFSCPGKSRTDQI